MTSQDKLFTIDENGYLPHVKQIESPNYDLRAPKQSISLIVIQFDPVVSNLIQVH